MLNFSELNPQGYDQKRKLFRTNSFVLAQSSAKKFYVEQLTVKSSPNNIKYQTDTELSNEYWNIISASKTSNVSWETLGTQKPYNQSSKRYLLCLNEKLVIVIALHKAENMLNKTSEIISKFRRRNKYMLASYDSKD